MNRRVYVHVGAPKTGTTYVQDRLGLNARSLASHDVHVPSRNLLTSPALSQFRAALDLREEDWGGAPGHAEGAWKALARRIRRLRGTVVVSHEILAAATPEQVARAHEDLAGPDHEDAELHIVYSARDLARQVPAAWQESIKQGRGWTYRRFCTKVRHGRHFFADAFDLPGVLTTWGAGLPPERLHLVTVPQASGPELWLRYCRAFGIDPAWAPIDSAASNPSLGVAEAAMLRGLNRRLNRRTDRDQRREARFDELIRQLLAEDRLVRRRSTPLLLPPRMGAWAEEETDRWAQWVEQSGIDVIGDLADLRPAPTEDIWVDPDERRPGPQLVAALDALTAMTMEATRRGDPDAGLLGRARARLREGR